MKKFLSLLCMITCVFGLTACGSKAEAYSEYEQQKLDLAKQVATQYVIPSFENFKEEQAKEDFAEYTADEVAYLVQQNLGINTDGYAYKNAIESFYSGYQTIGNIVSIGEATAEIDDSQIIVYVQIQGEKKSAEAEVIFSNDMFMKLESASLNAQATTGELIGKAAMNTLIGMGTVFVVLILISGIISCFAVIPKIQAALTKKKELSKKKEETTGIDNAVAQIVEQEEVDAADDLELVAVIAAAIAASEGATSTDGFVVRSIRKVRRY